MCNVILQSGPDSLEDSLEDSLVSNEWASNKELFFIFATNKNYILIGFKGCDL